MRTSILRYIIFLILTSVSLHAYASPEKLVLIGGLHEHRIGKCDTQYCPDWGYLTWPEKLGNSLNDLDGSISIENRHEFLWSGDPVTHGEGGNLKSKFENWFYNEVCSRGVECNVSFISHSWGTIINSDFIASLPSNTAINIRSVVTYGSPVTGAQIKWNTTPFWETAVNRVRDMGASWINVVNPGDVVAWDIPNTLNRKPDGSTSQKGRFEETFPVSNSEMDLQYLGTSFIRQCNPINSAFCSTLGNNVYTIWDSSLENVPTSADEWSTYFSNTHFTENYEPNRLISYIKSNLPIAQSTAKPYFDGTGSLIDPEHKHDNDGCFGCGHDYVELHSHGEQPSAGFFQVYRVPGVCESIDLKGLGVGSVEVRSWDGRGTKSKYYTVNGDSVIPLTFNPWNLIAFKTASPIPAGSSKTVQAYCRKDNNPNVYEISGTPMEFDNSYYWGGECIINTSF